MCKPAHSNRTYILFIIIYYFPGNCNTKKCEIIIVDSHTNFEILGREIKTFDYTNPRNHVFEPGAIILYYSTFSGTTRFRNSPD